MELSGKRIIVTGAAGVLGCAVVEKCRALGGEPVGFDVVPSDGCIAVDLTNHTAVADAVSRAGAIDGVCNIAGGFAMGPRVDETSEDEWRFLFDINVTTLRHVLAATVPVLIERGRGTIVNVGAAGALRGVAHMGAYAAAKSTVMRLTEAQSDELKSLGINVNAVLPSIIDTPRNRADMPDADYSTWVTPEALADVVCFLSSEAARAVHGALVPVTGLA